MPHFTPLSASLGGVLLGVASSLLFFANGRILGISGIVGEVPFARGDERLWRVVFLAGLVTGGLLLARFDPDAFAFDSLPSLPFVIVAGVAVGAGTRIGGGCTSGHGLCGIARLSKRSMVATGVFMLTGAITVFVVRHVLHLASGAS